MKLKRLIEQIPFAATLHKKFIVPTQNRSRKRKMEQLAKQLEDTPYAEGRQFAEALKSLHQDLPQPDQDWVDGIERERQRLLCSQEPLVNGSLNEEDLPHKDDDVTIQQACMASKGPVQALLLFMLTRTVNPTQVIELGTNVGISSAYIGAAMKINGKGGKLITLDRSPYRLRLAQEVHRNLGIDNISCIQGVFTDTLKPSLRQLGSVDLAFIDGHHRYQPTLDYFDEVLEFSTPDGVFVFDDIRWSDGMRKAWSKIQSDDRLGVLVDLSSVGICARHKQEISQRFVFDPIKVLKSV